jgi:hypothetical protein
MPCVPLPCSASITARRWNACGFTRPDRTACTAEAARSRKTAARPARRRCRMSKKKRTCRLSVMSFYLYMRTSASAYFCTSVLLYFRTSVLPYFHTSVLPYIRTSVHPYILACVTRPAYRCVASRYLPCSPVHPSARADECRNLAGFDQRGACTGSATDVSCAAAALSTAWRAARRRMVMLSSSTASEKAMAL